MKKLKKLIIAVIIACFMVIALGQLTTANAANAGPMYLGIVSLRRSGYGYTQSEKKVWKIAQYTSTNEQEAPNKNKTIYCIKAGPGFGSTDMMTGGTPKISTYTQKFNLKDLASISSPYKDVLPSGENYNKLMWLLDNIYILPEIEDNDSKNAYLKKIIPDESYSLITTDELDVIQQLAVWYFTNPTGTYHYSADEINLFRNAYINQDDNYKNFKDLLGASGLDKIDAIKELYSYYINSAPANYVSTNNATKPVELVSSNAKMQTINANYVAGPYKINKLLNVNYNLTALYTDMNEKTINPTLAIKDASGNIVTTNKTISELVGQEFYLVMPTSSDITGIKITISSSYTTRTADYWSVADAPNTEQPVVVVDETPQNFEESASIVVPKPFDLSLRKFIIEVNGKELSSREPQVDVKALAAGTATTATYNHTKTPVKVQIGDTVTYKIRVYNEGSEDGYVSEITDHLPEQLEFLKDDPINQTYGWHYASSSDLKTLKTSYLSKDNETSDGENKISAFNGTTLSYKEVQIKCKVVATTPMANKITNIADITGFTDANGNQVTDRDSQANNVTLPTGSELENYRDADINRGDKYIPGQQDDDDFEKLILKEFDLALRKFITGVNDEEITSRIPTPDLSTLKAGTSTTAIYNHSKDPVRVAIGDTVIYTIRVYNEAETDGYASEITDHIPEQLEFLPSNSTNISYEWEMLDKDGNVTTNVKDAVKVRTSYLSKDKETSSRQNKIVAFDGTTLAYKDVKIAFKVVETNPMASKITNIADITKFTNGNGETVTDRDSQENNVNVPTGKELEDYKDSEISKNYVPGQQDDDDFEKLVLKVFDLSLRKFITKLNDEDITSRVPEVDTTALAAGTATTATYNHTKSPVAVSIGDKVVYTIRVYNEGDNDGYASEITDHIPEQLKFLPEDTTNQMYEWEMIDSEGNVTNDASKAVKIRTSYLSKAKENETRQNKLVAFNGTTLSYKDVKIAFEVVSTDPMPNKITNIADITGFTNENGETVKDRDSQENNVVVPTGTDLENYKDNEISKNYVPGQQDDDDFEKLVLKQFDLSLRKFITKINDTKVTSRIPQVDVTPLKDGTSTTAIYNHSKEPVKVSVGSIVEYTIRVYNEGQIDGYANTIKDHIPEQLEYLPDNATNKQYEWEMLDKDGNVTTDVKNATVLRTSYLSKDKETATRKNKISAFDGTTLDYKDVVVAFRVKQTDPMPNKITNIADISGFSDKDGNDVKDRDSDKDNVKIPEDLPGYKDDEINNSYVPGQEDDDDFEKVSIVEFDLALRKFITAVNDTQITSRIPQVDVSHLKDGTATSATYTHPKDPVLVSNGNIVTYTIRVFNEGEMDGYASLIKDDIPEGLRYLPDNDINKEYRWTMLDKDGNATTNVEDAVSIVSDYLSKEQEKVSGENLLKAFNKNSDTLSFKDVKVAFEVIEPATSDRIVINQAQISKNTDKDGNDVHDRDSVPDKWNDGEDDQDIEKVKVQYFDLALRKWVTQTIVIENGEEKVVETGHTAEDDLEAVAKVDLKKSKINNVTVKFRYKIRVRNEGNIAGYAKEIKDYIPDGLKFVKEDNPLWEQVDDKTIVTDQTKDTLLAPGEETVVEVLLTWINSEDNMKVMDNWAEISKDYNDYGSPDIDSTPDNNKHGEDDIDDAPVLVTIQTGQIVMYFGMTFAVLAILTGGLTLIKKFVL